MRPLALGMDPVDSSPTNTTFPGKTCRSICACTLNSLHCSNCNHDWVSVDLSQTYFETIYELDAVIVCELSGIELMVYIGQTHAAALLERV